MDVENEDPISLIGQFLEQYEITGNVDDIVPTEEFKLKTYGKDWKKIKIELEGMGVII